MSVDRIISAESGGNAYAKNPRSSATGAGQFIASTWADMLSRYRPDLTTGRSLDEILALRNDPVLSKEMTAAYAKENQGLLGAAGVPVNDGTTYLAHFAGPQGAIKVLQADPSAPVGGILGDKVVAANPFLKDMTAGDLVGWAGKKMGVAPAQPATDMGSRYQPQQAMPQLQPPPSGGLIPQQPTQAPPSAGLLNSTLAQPAAQPSADPFANAEKEHFAAIKAIPMLGLQPMQRRMAYRR